MLGCASESGLLWKARPYYFKQSSFLRNFAIKLLTIFSVLFHNWTLVFPGTIKWYSLQTRASKFPHTLLKLQRFSEIENNFQNN